MFPAWPFRHFDFEMLPIIATAVNEMLLQSHEGRIRLFAACPADYSGEFRLSAEGGFVVHSQMESGKVLFAEIEAARDGVIRLVDPWGQKRIYAARATAGGIEPGRYVETFPDLADDVAELKILAGERLIVAKTEHEIINRQGMAGSKPKNASAKQCGRAWLGVPRMF